MIIFYLTLFNNEITYFLNCSPKTFVFYEFIYNYCDLLVFFYHDVDILSYIIVLRVVCYAYALLI